MEPRLKTVTEVEGVPLSRMMKVEIKGFKTIETPARAATRKQLESKRYTPTSSTLDNEIIIVDFPMTHKDLTEQGFNVFFRRRLLTLARLYGETYPLHYLIPYFYPIGDEARRLLRDKNLVERIYIDTLVLGSKDQSGDYEISSILIPPLNLDFSNYKILLNKTVKVLEQYSVQAIPVIDFKNDKFIEILRFITEELGLNVVGLNYRKIRTELAKYTKLRQLYMDKDVLFIMINVPKSENVAGVSDFAIVHLMNFVGVDIVSTTLSKRTFVRGDEHTGVKYNLRLLNREELTLPLIMKLSGDDVIRFLEDAGITKEDPKVKDIVEVLSSKERLRERLERISRRLNSPAWREQREAAEELRRIRSITVFQEIKSSTKEFGRLRDAIARGELADYIKEKRNLKRAVNSVNPLKKLTK